MKDWEREALVDALDLTQTPASTFHVSPTSGAPDQAQTAGVNEYVVKRVEEILVLLQICCVMLGRAPDRIRYLTSPRHFTSYSHAQSPDREDRNGVYEKLQSDLKRVGAHLHTASDKLWSMVVDVTNSDLEAQGNFTVFISHAGEDKEALAVPIWAKLRLNGVRAFIDREDLRCGENANEQLEEAMRTAPIGLFILSTEFAAKKWTMKELDCFIERVKAAKAAAQDGAEAPLIIPVFYRLGVNGWEDKNLFRRSEFATNGFLERQEAGETSIMKVKESLRVVSRHTGIENKEGAKNDPSVEMVQKRARLVDAIVRHILGAIHLRTRKSPKEGGMGNVRARHTPSPRLALPAMPSAVGARTFFGQSPSLLVSQPMTSPFALPRSYGDLESPSPSRDFQS